MPAFPRTVEPERVSELRGPSPLVAVGQTRKPQLRVTNAVGWSWEETFPPLNLLDPVDAALIATVMDGHQNGTVFQAEHPQSPGSGRPPNGAGGGTPLVDGASQTGTSLVTDGWPASTTNVVRARDIIQVGGLNQRLMVTADASSDAGGAATISVTPAIASGDSPADNAVITVSGVTFDVLILDPPNVPTGGIFVAGLTVRFWEAL